MSANAGPVYSHRPMQPTVRPSTNPGGLHIRVPLLDSLDTIKKEYDTLHTELNGVRSERDELEVKLAAQVAELNSVRTALCDLESQNRRLRLQFQELQSTSSQYAQGLSGRGPEPILHRNPPADSNSFTSQPEPHGRSDQISADRPPSLAQSLSRVPLNRAEYAAPLRMTDNDPDRVRERLTDWREPKRHRPRRDQSDADYAASPTGPPVAGPSTYNRPLSPIAPSRGGWSNSPKGAAEPLTKRKKILSHDELTLDTVPADCKKEGADWHVLYNPTIKKALDINLVHTFVHPTIVCCVQFSPDGRVLATGCDRITQLFDVTSGTRICVLEDLTVPKKGDHYIRSIKFSPDSKLLATGAEDYKLRIWDITARKILHTLEGHTEEIYSVDFSRDGRYIVSGSADMTLRVWDTRTNTAQVISLEKDTAPGAEQGFTCVSISPDSTLVAGGTLDTVIRVYDLATCVLVGTLSGGHGNSVYSVAFTPDGRGIISGSLDMSVKLWDITPTLARYAERKTRQSPNRIGKEYHPPVAIEPLAFIGHTDFVLSASITPDSRWVVSGSKDRSVCFWDSASSDLQFVLNGHTNSVISLHVNPLGGMLATGSGDLSARLWTYSPI